MVAAVTNRWTNAELAGDRSRGLLVRDALARQSAAEAAEFIADEVLDHEFAGFYLVIADTQSATLVQWDGELTTHQLDSGVHIVMNVGSTLGFDIPESGRANVPGPVATGGERRHRAPEQLATCSKQHPERRRASGLIVLLLRSANIRTGSVFTATLSAQPLRRRISSVPIKRFVQSSLMDHHTRQNLPR